MKDLKKDLLRKLPSVSALLETDTARQWLNEHPRGLVTDCLRDAADELRRQILQDAAGRCGPAHVTADFVLLQAGCLLARRISPHIRGAINATGIILHTGLGRAVWPACVVDSMIDELKGCVTLATDRDTGQRIERDELVEYILTELTGSEAATVVNNNAAGTMIALAALGAGREVIVSRGQLIEIGGSFRLPDVMAQSGCRMVEVGTTNRTHLRDYERAITDATAIIFRAHPSNFRVVGFTKSVELEELVKLGRDKGLTVVDDLGAGALIGLERFGLPHEPTMRESIASGADVVLASGDKLMGASQAGIIVGKRQCIERIRKHPLARALRVDKTCLLALERTLHLFRDPELLVRENPTYRMLATTPEALRVRAEALAAAIDSAANASANILPGVGYLGSGSLPMEQLPTFLVALSAPGIKAQELARRLRMDDACIFARIENDKVMLDVRTMTDEQIAPVAAAVARAAP
jgi:L-seryl-tRNA(Ser) seleniumtransferase